MAAAAAAARTQCEDDLGNTFFGRAVCKQIYNAIVFVDFN